MNCESCNKVNQSVSFVVHEGILARLERIIKRLWIVIILLIVLLVSSNIAWIVYESQFEDISITATQEASDNGNNYAIGGDMIGEANSNNQKTSP